MRFEGSRFDRCKWLGCKTECVDEIELCDYHFSIIGQTYVHRRTIFGADAIRERNEPIKLAAEEREQRMAEWSRSRSVVYYVRLGDHVKIGYTINLPERVSQLRVERDALLAVEPGWREQEHARHGEFAAERQGRRENFNPSRRLLAHVEAVRHKFGEPWGYAARRVKAAGPMSEALKQTA